MVDLIVHEIIQSSKCKLFWLFLKKDLQFHKNNRKLSTVRLKKGLHSLIHTSFWCTSYQLSKHKFIYNFSDTTNHIYLCKFQLIIFMCVNIPPADIYLFKVDNGNIWTMCEIFSKSTTKTIKWRRWHRSDIFDKISHIVLVFPLFTLNKSMSGRTLVIRYFLIFF